MTDFHRTSVDDRSFIRGAARILYAPMTTPRPTKIADVIHLAAVVGPPAINLYDPVYTDDTNGWVDLGATKTGIQITLNNAEETFDVDQIMGDIASAPTSQECSVGTQWAEFTPEKMKIAWEGSEITKEVIAATGDEEEIGFGEYSSYTQRRLAVVFMRPNGKIRAYLFWKVQRMPQESSVTHAKTGEQISIPNRFRVLADPTVTNPKKRFFIIRDQMPKPVAP